MEIKKRKQQLSIRIQRPVTKDLFEVATGIWRSGRKVTVPNLTKTCASLGVKATKQNINDMVNLSDFLDLVCPM